MRHGSLFSGIGGFDLAAEWMGWTNVFHCEWNAFGQQILKHHFPNAKSYTNIKTTDFTIHRGDIDVLTGGFPCQPYSEAGKRLGTEDERHLWPEMLRAIREIQPTWVVGENVRGLTNWNGGVVFNKVQADLEAEGYEVTPFLLPACAVNAPHRRDRIWFVAYSGCSGTGANAKRFNESRELLQTTERQKNKQQYKSSCESGVTSDTDSNIGCEGRMHKAEQQEAERHVSPFNARSYERRTWDNFPTQSPLCSRNDGLSSELVGITFSKHRNESIKAYGNAIVPQVALQIFKAIVAS